MQYIYIKIKRSRRGERVRGRERERERGERDRSERERDIELHSTISPLNFYFYDKMEKKNHFFGQNVFGKAKKYKLS